MYASKLTREDLINNYGIIGVSPSGKSIMRKNKHTGKIRIQTKFCMNNSGYYLVTCYSAKRRKSFPKEKRNQASGQVIIPLHKIIYAYMYGSTTEGLVIDHINKDKTDNDYRNLREITPQENIIRDTNKNTRTLYTVLTKEELEAKLEYYIEAYEQAKKNKDAKEAHRLRANISNTRARLRYLKESNKDENN